MAMSDDVKRWVGSTAVGVLLAGIALAGWAFLGSSEDSKPTDRPGATDSPTSTPAGSGPPNASGTPTGAASPTYINAAPGETPPVRPPDEVSDAGAEAFFRYYVQAVDWAMATMDPTLLKNASLSSCANCQAMIDIFDSERVAQSRYEGGRYTIQTLTTLPEFDGPTKRRAIARVDISAYSTTRPDGTVTEAAAHTLDVSMTAEHRASAWRVSVLISQEVR